MAMDPSEMSVAEATEWSRISQIHREVRDIALRLQRYEELVPGTILAVASIPIARQSEWLWELRHGNRATDPYIDLVDGEYRVIERSYGHAYAVVVPTPGVDAARLTENGHCVVGHECSSCQWESMTPAEREEENQKWEAKNTADRIRRRSSRAEPLPSGPPVDTPLADWEIDLMRPL